MSYKRATLPVLAVMIIASGVAPASAQEAPYDDQLNELAEVMGSIHYLSNLCSEPSNLWRDEMQGLLSAETPDAGRRARLTASFNHGYRSFESIYVTCTDQARQAHQGYIEQGIELTIEINARFAQ